MTVYLGKAVDVYSGTGGGSGGDAVWGSITGTLSNQTDLQTALNGKQTTLTAGSCIDITNNVISATYSAFTGTDGVDAGTTGLVPAPTIADEDKFLKGDGTWSTAGANYTAGTNISIVGNTISATDTTYSAGTGIDIINNVISVDSVTPTEVTLATVATSGSYSDLSNKPTVDQVYDGTSANAQSGVAIAGILGNIETLLSQI